MPAARGASWSNARSGRNESDRDFLALLVTEEIAQRQQTRIARMLRRRLHTHHLVFQEKKKRTNGDQLTATVH